MKSRSIAVIGGGSVGTSFVRQLAEQLDSNRDTKLSEVYVYEPCAAPGAGVAYQEDTAANLLNTRVSSMSPIADDPSHFYRWLESNRNSWEHIYPGLDINSDSFVPRALFGRYLSQVFRDSMAILHAKGVNGHHLVEKVSSVRKLREGYEVVSAGGVSRLVDAVVLSIGNLETNEWDHLRDYPGYFSTPYPCTRLSADIDPGSSVCIMGSSLSAIDAAVSLADAGHKGKIMMVSRNGRIPSVRGNQNLARTSTLLSRERMQELVSTRSGQVSLLEIAELLMKEVELTEGQAPDLAHIMRSGQGPQRYLDSEIGDATLCDRAWQAILYSTNQSIDLIWHALSSSEKRHFQKDFKSLWHSYRVSFPVQNALKIQQLLHSDQLTIYAGYKETFHDEASGRFVTRISDRTKAFDAVLYSDVVVNATGYTNDLGKMRSPLLKAMQFNGLLSPNEFGGVDMEFETGRVIARSGAVMHGLFALGSLASGTYFWTNAMNVNTRLAAGVVSTILGDLSKTKAHTSLHSRVAIDPSDLAAA